jgi:hypothetical protein
MQKDRFLSSGQPRVEGPIPIARRFWIGIERRGIKSLFSFLQAVVLASFGSTFYLLNVLSFAGPRRKNQRKGPMGSDFCGLFRPTKIGPGQAAVVATLGLMWESGGFLLPPAEASGKVSF